MATVITETLSIEELEAQVKKARRISWSEFQERAKYRYEWPCGYWSYKEFTVECAFGTEFTLYQGVVTGCECIPF